MFTLKDYIVEPFNGVRYDNVRMIAGVPITISTSIEDHKTTNRLAVVKATPKNDHSGISIGDVLIVHHNTFRQFYDHRGKLTYGDNYIGSNQYILDSELIYMYSKDAGKTFVPNYPYFFVEPIKSENTFETFILETGRVVYSSSDLALPGDTVRFTKDSEYEFRIHGQLLYRMKENDLLWKD